MSDEEMIELWEQMDRDFSAVVQSSEAEAQHAHVGRADLEDHMRLVHGIVGHGTLRDAGARVEVVELSAETEAKLRVSHWRAHATGFMGHRP